MQTVGCSPSKVPTKSLSGTSTAFKSIVPKIATERNELLGLSGARSRGCHAHCSCPPGRLVTLQRLECFSGTSPLPALLCLVLPVCGGREGYYCHSLNSFLQTFQGREAPESCAAHTYSVVGSTLAQGRVLHSPA